MNLDNFVLKNAPTACKGILTAVGMCGSVIFGVAVNSAPLSPFAAFGALIAMHITPRHGVKAKIIGAFAGCLFLLLAATLSQAIAGYPLLALIFLFGLSWLAALPKNNLAYLGFVAKCATVGVLLGYFDFTPSLLMALYFSGGILLGIFLSLADMAFEHEDQPSPLAQLRAMLGGAINNPYASLAIPATVIIASLLAELFSFSDPAWVGLTVVFVANPDPSKELRRLLERTVGTIIGAFVAYALLYYIHSTLQLALIVGVMAFFLPFAGSRYGVFCLFMTAIVLVLIDIAMASQGGDMRLLFWRCMDTVFGCVCVLVSDLILKSIYWLKDRHKTG